MPIFYYSDRSLSKVEETTFSIKEMREREDLQAALKKNISAISDDLLVISEEFSEWSHGQRRIDLLAIDKQANIVVIELKRTDSGNYMELQAIRYAAMISQLTWKDTVEIFGKYMETEYPNEAINAEQGLLKFLDWDEPREDDFGTETHILLVSADFSDELTTSVLWLNDMGLNIRCVQISPYQFEGKVLINVQQIIPIPETEDYQVRVRRKGEEKKTARQQNRDLTKYLFKNEEYKKRRLVLAVIKDWVGKNKPQNIKELVEAFSQDIAPGWAFAILNEAGQSVGEIESAISLQDIPSGITFRILDGTEDYARYYFTGKDDRIYFKDGTCCVIAKMWAGDRHKRFVEVARGLGYAIEEVV